MEAENKLADRKALVRSKLKARAAVSNGTSLFVGGVDGRSREARRYRDLFRHYMALADGQHEELCRQAASLVMQRELLDAAMVSGATVDVGALTRLAGCINRTIAQLNLGSEAGAESRRREDHEAGLT